MVSNHQMAKTYQFGPYRLDASAKTLFRGSEPVALGRRAVVLLECLLEQAGTPVSKDILIEFTWHGLAVEESNLTVQIAAVRRVFENGVGEMTWIETLPRRGYRYTGPPPSTNGSPSELSSGADRLRSREKPSVAVLPFLNLCGDSAQDYFVDGMVEDIIAGLSRINWLFVVARSSSFTFNGMAANVRLIGHELGVRYLLQGSLRRDGTRVRVSAQMIEAESGGILWTERFDRQFNDIFSIQDDIALNVVGAIEPNLRRLEVQRVKRKRPDSLDAYDLVLQAQTDVYSGMPAQVTKALVLVEKALALDPVYPLAHAFAAMCHHCLFLRAGLEEAERLASIRHAQAAILNGRDDALALTFAGFSIGMDGHDRASAFSVLEAALAVSPSSAVTYILGGVIFGWAGEAEKAIKWGEQAIRLSPFDPWAFSTFHALTLGNFRLGRFDEAAKAAYRAVQSNPAHSISYMLLTAALVKIGRLNEARGSAKKVLDLQPGFKMSQQFSGVNCAPELVISLGEALRSVGLPE